MRDPLRTRRMVLQGLSALTFCGTAAAEDEPAKDKDAKPSAKRPDKPAPEAKSVTHEFSGVFHGQRLAYTTTAAELYLRNPKGEPTASLFHVDYVRKDGGDPNRRPVTFAFNGGPGSSSTWLHLGVLGPKRIVLPAEGGNAGAAPYQLVDNPESLLDATDLVFIDPVGTGYSRALGDSKDEDFWGLETDARSIASFIRTWLTQNGRWNAPKYLAGESYGTTRSAQVIEEIQTGYDAVTFRGVMLISSVLDFHTMSFSAGNDLPYVAYLPSYAAAAWFHGKVSPKPPNLAAFLAEVRDFAGGEYLVALLKGSALTGADRSAIVKRLAAYSGLTEAYLEEANLRVSASRFMKELLRDVQKTVGRYDARILGEDHDAAGERPEGDPSFYAIDGAFVAAINDYLSRALKVGIDRDYKILEGQPSGRWKWGERRGPGSFVNVAPSLGQAMRENRDFRVFVASGYYDLAAPFYGTDFTLANNGIKPERVTTAYFEAGHMMYTHTPSRDRLTRAMRDFVTTGS